MAEEFDESMLRTIFQGYRNESEQARLSRIQMNKVNFDSYHMRQDYSYKEKGQSQEFLPKQSMAVDQNVNTLMQGLVDMGDWFKVYPAPGFTEAQMKIKPYEIQKILTRQLVKSGFMTFVNDSLKLGFLGSLMVAKIHGKYVPKATYKVETKSVKGSYKKRLVKKEDKKWQLVVQTVRQQDWRPDPTGSGVYKMQDVYMDWHELKAVAEADPEGYDMDAIESLKATSSGPALQEYEKSRETGQNMYNTSFRHRLQVTEIWGDFVAPDGTLVWEKCVARMVNNTTVIQRPTPFDLWHGEDPYVQTPLVHVPHSVWGKTPVDAGSLLNIAINELFNLILDGGLSAVHGVKQVREHWLEDPAQLEDGVPPGTTLRANTSCPPGMTAFERVDTTTIPPEVLPVYNLLMQEFVTAMMTDDLRMGAQPQRQVKATEIVASSQANSSMLTGLAQHIETNYLKPILEKSWLTCAQHLDDFDDNELVALLGQSRADAILKMGPEELFADTAGTIKFEVFGVSATLNKQKEFTKLQAMLQTIASSPVLMEEFTKEYDFGKLLKELLVSLDVPIYKIQNDEALFGGDTPQPQAGPQGVVPSTPNAQSQIPQAGAAVNQGADQPSAIPQPKFPASRALAVGGGKQ